MLSDGKVTIISNSWAYCEDQTTLADVTALDAIFQQAAGSGISVFNSTGDSGSTCLDGAANTISVPADSPNATAVGGSSIAPGPGDTYNSETFWKGNTATPPTGQGGFGVSTFFARPSYQVGLNSSSMRSVPDLVSNADPVNGVVICQADNGGCPSTEIYGGTSGSAPTWAAFAALLNQSQGSNLGAFNSEIYPFANTAAFHNPTELGVFFLQAGLGSPNLNALHLMLTSQSVGPVSGSLSFISTMPVSGPQPADGSSVLDVVVYLLDANGNQVSGKGITLAANAGTHALISPNTTVTNANNGAAVFAVTDATAETLTFTATDTTDNIPLAPINFTFATPAAIGGTIMANPTSVNADGTTASTITVALHDASNNPSPGKQVILSQAGHSMISGPSPSVTDGSGQIQFNVTDTIGENLTYTATDVSDGNLPVPGSAAVQFTGGTNPECAFGIPVVAPGSPFNYTNFATGFISPAFDDLCFGPSGMAFDQSGNMYVATYFEGNIYKFGPSGGTASPAQRLTATPYPSGTSGDCLSGLAFSKDGQHLYMARQFCGNGGDVIEISPTDGSMLRTVAGGISCATGLATDPISGDLFVSQPCGLPTGSNDVLAYFQSAEWVADGLHLCLTRRIFRIDLWAGRHFVHHLVPVQCRPHIHRQYGPHEQRDSRRDNGYHDRRQHWRVGGGARAQSVEPRYAAISVDRRHSRRCGGG